MTTSLKNTSERDLGIDRCKGLLIVLVVFGHLVSGTSVDKIPDSFDWYKDALHAVYFFHMPAFLYLSGLISYRSLSRLDLSETRSFVFQRADRLLIPFFCMGILIAVGKISSTLVFGNDAIGGNVGSGLFDSLKSLFWQTSQSPSRSIWFLFCYFVFLVVSIPFARSRRGLLTLLGVAMGLYFIGLPPVFYANKMAAHFVFFALGLCSAAWMNLEQRLERTGLLVLSGLLLASFAIVRLDGYPKIVVLVYGTLMGPILIQLCRGYADRILLFFGQNTMAIYILNTIVIGLFSAFSLKMFGQESGMWMYILLFVAFPAALFVPILIKNVLIRLVPSIGRYLA